MLQVRRGYSRETSFKRVRLPGVGGAAQAVRDAGSPLDGSHAELASGPPLRAELFHSAVRLALDGVQRDRLARGCLGRVVRGEPPPRACDNALRGCGAGAGGAGDGSAAPGGAAPPALEAVHLSPEEAFFMVHDLGCLEVVRGSTGDGGVPSAPLSSSDLWSEFCRLVPRFPFIYAAFLHLRAAGWMCRPGLQFGADFVLYRRHPEYVHSDYAALVLPPGAHEVPFLEMQAIGRMCEQVNKGVVYVRIDVTEGFGQGCSVEGGLEGLTGPEIAQALAAAHGRACVDHMTLELCEISRFLQEKGRNQSGPVRCEYKADLDVAAMRAGGVELPEEGLRELLPAELWQEADGEKAGDKASIGEKGSGECEGADDAPQEQKKRGGRGEKKGKNNKRRKR